MLPLGASNQCPLLLDISWLNGPAALALPVTARRPLDGQVAFRIRAISPKETKLGASIKLYSIDENDVQVAETWAHCKKWEPLMESVKDVHLKLVRLNNLT